MLIQKFNKEMVVETHKNIVSFLKWIYIGFNDPVIDEVEESNFGVSPGFYEPTKHEKIPRLVKATNKYIKLNGIIYKHTNFRTINDVNFYNNPYNIFEEIINKSNILCYSIGKENKYIISLDHGFLGESGEWISTHEIETDSQRLAYFFFISEILKHEKTMYTW